VLHASIGVWILVAVLFLGGAQLISVGVLGRYLAHVHDQVLQRPLYLVTRVVSRHETSTPAPAARP
jgi:dolichol-phosphate mannosyltransferase